MKLFLQTASSTDAGVIADFARQTFETAFGPDNDPEDMRAYLNACFSIARIQEELEKPDVVYLLAYADNLLVGYVKLAAGPPPDYDAGVKPVQLSRIYVASHLLGKGLGSQLMQLTLQECRQLGYESVWLGVWERNTKAQRFYKRCGYQKIGTKSFILGSDKQVDTVYLLDLN
jgi:ribosomal protein S18 acetylase RimI-like enzyme